MVDDDDVRRGVVPRQPLGRELRLDGSDDAVVDQRVPDLGAVLEGVGLEPREVRGLVEVEAGLLRQRNAGARRTIAAALISAFMMPLIQKRNPNVSG